MVPCPYQLDFFADDDGDKPCLRWIRELTRYGLKPIMVAHVTFRASTDMSDDFKNLIEDIEADAKAEGSEAELREMRREFSIASQLMTLRREKKLTQEQLAQASGIPQSEISRIETGDANPTYATLSALAEPFGVQVGFIVSDAA